MHIDLLKCTVLIFFSILLPIEIAAQVKYEKEVRVKSTEVPIRAIDFTDELPFEYVLKWYKKIDLVDTSYEMKTRHLKVDYSIAFDSKGEVEDMRYEIAWKKIPRKTQDSISAFLSREYRGYRVYMVKEVNSGSNGDLISQMRNRRSKPPIKTQFVVQVHAKEEHRYRKIEFLFSVEGSMVSKTIIVERGTSNLEY